MADSAFSTPNVSRLSGARGQASRGTARRRSVTRQWRRFEAALDRFNVRPGLARTRQAADVMAGTGMHRSKIASFLLLVAVAAAITWSHVEDQWFIYSEDVHFTHVERLSVSQLYAISGVEGWNIFWLQPDEVRERLVEHPFIADAEVQLSLPGRVSIDVTEEEPVALWVTNNGTYWLAQNGAALPVETELTEAGLKLPRIVDSLQDARALGGGLAVDPQVLESAVALAEALPDLNGEVRYNRHIGLNFPYPGKPVWVYWGDGHHTEKKLQLLEAAGTVVDRSDKPPQIVDVSSVNHPYVR
jgi:cell division septal protein FtsQ